MMDIRTHPKGSPPDFTIQWAPNAYETRAQQWFKEQLLKLEPGTKDGGGYTHKPGYHDTVEHNDQRSGVAKDYSAKDPQDRRGSKNKTRARDWTFPFGVPDTYIRMAKYGRRLNASYLDMNDPRLDGWREVLGQTDSDKQSEGIDIRYRYYRTPDSTHEWHWHFSEDTEQVESFDNKWRMLTVLAGWTTEEWRKSITPREENIFMALNDAEQRELLSLLRETNAAALNASEYGYRAAIGSDTVAIIPNNDFNLKGKSRLALVRQPTVLSAADREAIVQSVVSRVLEALNQGELNG